jgi:uncharacterized protein YxjI
MKKLFELHQKITFLVNEYVVLKDTAEDKQEVTGYAKQKRLTLREKFTLFTDETHDKILAASQARSVLDFAPIFDIQNESGKPLAVLKKEFKKSLLVSSWVIYDIKMQNILFTIQETSVPIAILRRVWNFLPFIAEFPFPLKFHFTIRDNNKAVGKYIKTTLIRDNYALYLEDKHSRTVDERVWIVSAILLDAMQSR